MEAEEGLKDYNREDEEEEDQEDLLNKSLSSKFLKRQGKSTNQQERN
uniref:Uncharacterized protein n=1 Tax=Candidatus Kentrum sp. UNK TaxID=2126344 RepID=A0A451AP67_9GAMM|nr:MAG: hypothetical protein BECKUNK1418G_GA0071005_11635 [Candidatus Kentron sp. UNK]